MQMQNWMAVWGNLIVLPKEIEETDELLKSARAAGIEVPDSEEHERRQQGQIEGTIVDFGGNCFQEWSGEIPKRGDEVVYDKFAGFSKTIGDSEYRIIHDTDIFLIRRKK